MVKCFMCKNDVMFASKFKVQGKKGYKYQCLDCQAMISKATGKKFKPRY